MGNLITTTMQGLETNPELELAFEYLSQTRRHLFLTGKAGTGKTTFLRRVRKEIGKRKVVVAPTGVAAINAEGQTIHSLFQLPFGVLTPERIKDEMPKRRYSARKIDLFRSLQLLIIDEVSMVRADVLDAIDAVLQRYRSSSEPFGGLQLLMIGDLHQLPPVIRPEDWRELSPHYKTAYFFGSIALQKAAPTTVQLRKIYRQSDADFIGILNKVRNNILDSSTLKQLNERYIQDFQPPLDDDENFITLTSHNKAAQEINQHRLAELVEEAYQFTAMIDGDFPASMYPNDPHLTFKVGAQVMFNKNDTVDRIYFNGKIGVVTGIEGENIRVSCPDEPDIIVGPVNWENRKFELNPKTKEVDEKVVGTYTQHPLKLAWAITIHKSQGLTFDRVIIDAEAAFAHGQVYVALSRCKRLEGIVLRSPIRDYSVKTDTVVKNYSQHAEDNPPTEKELWIDKYDYQAYMLRQLFSFAAVENRALHLERILLENEQAIQDGTTEYAAILKVLDEEVVSVANRFMPGLNTYLQQQCLPTENKALKQRLDGAAPYFSAAIRSKIMLPLADFSVITDNRGVGEQVESVLDQLRMQLYIKRRLFEVLEDGFDPLLLSKTTADAQTEFSNNKENSGSRKIKIPKNLPNRELYFELAKWRAKTAKALGIEAHRVVAGATMMHIVEVLPTTKKSLLAVKRFGKKRFDTHGEAILELVKKYLENNQQASDLIDEVLDLSKPTKLDTKYQSLLLHQQGYDISEIAKARGLKEGTIFSHLAHWVLAGEVAIDVITTAQEVAEINQFMDANPSISGGDLYRGLDGKYDYALLGLVKKIRDTE